MGEFYRHLATGTAVGESLRQAKLTMRRQFGPAAVPTLWSGVLVSGDGAVRVTTAALAQR
jgi:CHAT domain-containing protein